MNVTTFYEVWEVGVIKALKNYHSFKNSFEQTVSRQRPKVCSEIISTQWSLESICGLALFKVEQNTICITKSIWKELPRKEKYPGGIE